MQVGLRRFGCLAVVLFALRSLLAGFPLPLQLVALCTQLHVGAKTPSLDKFVSVNCRSLRIVVLFADAIFLRALFGLHRVSLGPAGVIFRTKQPLRNIRPLA